MDSAKLKNMLQSIWNYIKRIFQVIWHSFKPFLYLLIWVGFILFLIFDIMILILIFDTNNTTFLILVVMVFVVICVFTLALLIAGIRIFISLLIKKEEFLCSNCGKIFLSRTKFCSSCGNDMQAN